jgi:hypothetical protein
MGSFFQTARAKAAAPMTGCATQSGLYAYAEWIVPRKLEERASLSWPCDVVPPIDALSSLRDASIGGKESESAALRTSYSSISRLLGSAAAHPSN